MNDKPLPQRKSPRLRGYDYSQSGAYFVTICTQRRQQLFGDVLDGEMILNDYGKIAAACWTAIPDHHTNVELDLYVIMPNHVHGIVVINDGYDSSTADRIYPVPTKNRDHVGTRYIASGAKNRANPNRKRPTLGTIIGTYKAAVTRRINRNMNQPNAKIWQGRYHDHIIRNEKSLNKLREYTLHNPALWADDRYYD